MPSVPPTVREVESGPDYVLWKGHGVMRLEWNRQGGLRMIVVGHGHAEYAEPILRRYDAGVRGPGKLVLLVDWWDMTAYDTPFRVEQTNWGIAHRGKFDLHILQRSKLVAMGVTVASLALPMMKTYTRRPDFDRLVQAHGFSLKPSMPK